MALEKITAVKGMNDILPEQSYQWEWLEDLVRQHLQSYGYRNIRTPIVEPTGLFIRGIGEGTDIVDKEMYSFEDKLNADQLTLRPENTAGVVRACVEHHLLYEGGKRLYYFGPMFRHERPQRGRYRQFHQIGAEALGFAGPELDAELILVAHGLWQKLGLTEVKLEINSLGQPAERQAHRSALIAYFSQHQDQLDEDAAKRLHSNPLRILDSKNPAMQGLIEAAPKLLDYLGDASLQHLKAVQAILDANGVAWAINPRLVRGLDYYNLTVFEFITTQLGSQGTICGGGRYDYLVEQVGGKPAPAVGWSIGVERVLELLREQASLPVAPVPDAYAVVGDVKDLPQVMACLQQLRAAGAHIVMQASGSEGMASLKSQFKKADASGAAYALIFGADEVSQNQLSLKYLRGPSEQQMLPLAAIDAILLALAEKPQAAVSPAT